ncbi:hypothetical protein [Paracoccus liaowanqingii]|uniref:hypothetical protein n=1 Tax=Paracoccus liaowanqingii TaxID=2560053 RepID=UPI0030B8892D
MIYQSALLFYRAIFGVMHNPIGGTSDDCFWADDLFISSKDSDAALGELTGRHPLAVQADSPNIVLAFSKPVFRPAEWTMARPGNDPTTQDILRPS